MSTREEVSPQQPHMLIYFCATLLRAILQESEANLEMKNFKPPSIFVWR